MKKLLLLLFLSLLFCQTNPSAPTVPEPIVVYTISAGTYDFIPRLNWTGLLMLNGEGTYSEYAVYSGTTFITRGKWRQSSGTLIYYNRSMDGMTLSDVSLPVKNITTNSFDADLGQENWVHFQK